MDLLADKFGIYYPVYLALNYSGRPGGQICPDVGVLGPPPPPPPPPVENKKASATKVPEISLGSKNAEMVEMYAVGKGPAA